MKITRSLLFIFIAGISLLACKKDDEPTPDETKIPDKFSSLTAEQNKKNLETNGIEIVNEMETLKNTEGVKANISFMDFISTSSPFNDKSSTSGRYFVLAKSISLFGQSKTGAKDIFNTMRLITEDPQTIKEAFEQNCGTYIWNKTTEDWEFSAGGSKIIFKFPSTSSGTTNNAVYTIHSYTGTVISNELLDDYEGDLPTGLMADLTVNGTKVMGYSFAAKYSSNGTPTFFETSLSLVPFTFTTTLVNETKEVSLSYSLAKDKKTLIKLGAGANGSFDTKDISNSENTGDVVSSGYAYIQLLNIKMSGNADVKKIDEGLRLIELEEDSPNYDKGAAQDKKATLLNENMQLVVFYVDSQTKIAETEVYTVEETEEYCESTFDQETWELITTECEMVTRKELDLRLIFEDDSRSSLENYADTGFTSLTEELEALLSDLEKDFE